MIEAKKHKHNTQKHKHIHIKKKNQNPNNIDMEIQKEPEKKPSSIMKKLERYLSSTEKEAKTTKKMLTKSKSMQVMSTTTSRGDSHNGKSGRNGCFSVYVGPEKQRFVIKAKVANHPLFKMLLEDAETEYGFDCGGPLLIPCDVDTFYKVMDDVDGAGRVESRAGGSSHGRSNHFFARTRSSCEEELLEEMGMQK